VCTPEQTSRILDRVKAVKTSTNKAPLRVMAARLDELWSRHLSFCEEEFWAIVYEETSRGLLRSRGRGILLACGSRQMAVPVESETDPAARNPAAL
jgi:hypothetical protein